MMDEQRLTEIEAIEPADDIKWLIGDERVSTKDVILMLVAEVRRLRSALEVFADAYDPERMAQGDRTYRDGPFSSGDIRQAHHALYGEPE